MLAARHRLAVVLSLLVLAGLGAAIAISESAAEASAHASREGIALNRDVALLRTLAAELAVNPTPRHTEQWAAGLQEVRHRLAAMAAAGIGHADLVDTLQVRLERSDELFRRLAALMTQQQATGRSGFQERTTDLLSITLQSQVAEVVRDALEVAGREVDKLFVASQWARLAAVLLAMTLLAVIVANMRLMQRSVLAPLRRLQETTEALAGGDMDARSGVSGPDEIGELGRHFDRMAGDLQKAYRRLEAANQEMESFSYSVSHDLRAPLRGVDGYSRILEEDYGERLDAEAKRIIGVIRHSAHEMELLIDDLLALSRVGRVGLRCQAVDMNALVAEAIASLREEVGERQVEFALAPLPQVTADGTLLRQVWVNLLANAVKFTRERPDARIEVGVVRQGEDDVFFVRDNGVGFDMKYAGKLFGVFQRLHRADEYEGTGVGLALVQRIVARHSGRVWAEARLQEGAAFFFTLGLDGNEG